MMVQLILAPCFLFDAIDEDSTLTITKEQLLTAILTKKEMICLSMDCQLPTELLKLSVQIYGNLHQLSTSPALLNLYML